MERTREQKREFGETSIKMKESKLIRRDSLSRRGIHIDPNGYELYMIKNTVNQKVYIGQTHQRNEHSSEDRFVEHLGDAIKPSGGTCTALNNALRKYGPASFTLEILKMNVPLRPEVESYEVLQGKDINDLEIEFIERHKSNAKQWGYNLNSGGKNGGELHPMTRYRQSIAHSADHHQKGKPRSEEVKQRISKTIRDAVVRLDFDKKTVLPPGIKYMNEKSSRSRRIEGYRAFSDDGKKTRMFVSEKLSMSDRKVLAMQWKAEIDEGEAVTNGFGGPVVARETRVRDWAKLSAPRLEAKRAALAAEIEATGYDIGEMDNDD